ncbi:hypothetical protein SLS56_008516 [Neofusicoccum ribis]|uniref:Uncharacterized protein n=1 Tax=Neofusicoccum ribis TaxID=45134 RepID=A0ABR3SJZ7_9PEZI
MHWTHSSDVFDLDKGSVDAAMETYVTGWDPERDVTWPNTTALTHSTVTTDFINLLAWRTLEPLGSALRHSLIIGQCASCYTAPQADNTYTLTTASNGNVSVARTILHPLLASLATDVLAFHRRPAHGVLRLATRVHS